MALQFFSSLDPLLAFKRPRDVTTLDKWCLALGAILALQLAGRLLSIRRRYLPPGPFAWPIVGNTFQFPTKWPWLKFTEWAREYGTFFFLLSLNRHHHQTDYNDVS
jgi:hypothetical protein